MKFRSLAAASTLSIALTSGVYAQAITGFPSVPMKDKRPVIGANYTGLRLRPETARMVMDGRDITGLCVIGPTITNFEPTYDLNPGRHNVSFTAVTEKGQSVNNAWSFTIESPRPNLLQLLAGPTIPNLSLDQKFPQGNANISRPEIGARFKGQLQTVRLMVDGQDMTNSASRTTNSIIWLPQYDVAPGNHNAQLVATGIHGHQVLENWSFQIPGNNSSGQPLEITRFWPKPGPNQSPRSKLGADFSENIASARLFADGQELTNQCSFSGNGIRWVPPQDLAPGNHNLRVVARSVSGQKLTRDWNFQVAPAQMTTYAASYAPPQPNWPESQSLATFPSDSAASRTPVGVTLPIGTFFRNYTMNLDGRDITPYVHQVGQDIYFQPDFDMQRGMHQVQFTGWNKSGQRTDRNWVFNVQ